MIRIAEIQDLEAINSIFNQAVKAKHQTAALTPITKEQRLKWYGEHDVENYPIFVLEVDKKVIGWSSLSAYRKGREALRKVAEATYYLDKNYHRQGYGTQLLEHAIENAPKYDFKILIGILFGHNVASIKLLEKFGFEKWGSLPKSAVIDGKWYDHTYYGLRL